MIFKTAEEQAVRRLKYSFTHDD